MSVLSKRTAKICLEFKKQVIRQQLEFQEVSAADLKNIRHDIKNNLANISYLLKQNHIEESVVYINAITSALEATRAVVNCGNKYIDSILNYAIALCKSNKINTQFEVDDVPDLNITPTDLSSIISNVLNNAIEANLKIVETERNLSLKIFCYKNYLSVVAKNPYKHVLTESDGILKTDKKDTLHHGHGLKSVESSVHHYGGTFKYSYENNVFTSIIMLPINS